MMGIILLYLLIHVILELEYEIEDLHNKNVFFVIYFCIVRISTNIVLKNLKSRVAVGGIHVEGTVSQNF